MGIQVQREWANGNWDPAAPTDWFYDVDRHAIEILEDTDIFTSVTVKDRDGDFLHYTRTEDTETTESPRFIIIDGVEYELVPVEDEPF